jgi:hypothetical protein
MFFQEKKEIKYYVKAITQLTHLKRQYPLKIKVITKWNIL